MDPSGKFVLRLQPRLHLRLREEARRHEVSLNEWIVSRLEPNPLEAATVPVEPILSAFDNQIEGVVLFGSTARGERRKDSDVDLLIVLRSDIEIRRGLYSAWDQKVAPLLGDVYSPQFTHLHETTQSASSLWLEVAMEGQVLFDPEGQVRKFMRALREQIAEGAFVRKLSHGHPYWVRREENAE